MIANENKLQIKVIGLGGVGTMLCDSLCRYLNYLEDALLEITLVDGDVYETKNLARQVFSYIGNKAKVKSGDLMDEFPNLDFNHVAEYVNQDNISEIITPGNIVFLCVDNHATRKVVSDHAGTLDNITLISGGNEFTDGNVQFYVRKGGVSLSPSLTDYHPEIARPGDRSPEDMSCEELSKSTPQLLFANMQVAGTMCQVFYTGVVEQNVPPHECAEVYFDLKALNMRKQERKTIENVKLI